MKICHVINNLKGGGAQNLLISLAIAQNNLGNELTVIVIDRDDLEYSERLKVRFEENRVRVQYLNRLVGNKWSSVGALVSMIAFLHKEKFDVINTHLEYSHMIVAIAKILSPGSRHFITIHNAPEKWSKLNSFFNREKPLIFCSLSASEMRVQKNAKTCIIPNGVTLDSNVEPSDFLRKNLGFSSEAKLVICVGSLRAQKNYSFLIELAKSTKDPLLHFLICGGSYGKGYLDESEFCGIGNIHLLGLRSDVAEIVPQCDVFLNCSLFEGLPIAILESLFTGIPIVASPIPQLFQILDGVPECYQPSCFDTKEFLDCIEKAYEANNKTKSEILEERLPLISRYDIVNTAKDYLAYYKSQRQ